MTGWLRLALVVLSLVPAVPVVADTGDDGEPRFEELERHLKRGWLDVGLLLQVVGDYRDERDDGNGNGFSVANARLSLGGELDEGFFYFFQGSFADSARLLDGFVGLAPLENMKVKAGLTKTPFSAEFLESAAAIDFVNRAQVVDALAPNRQLGVELSGSAAERRFRYRVGLFNGNRFSQGGTNDNDRLLSVARVSVHPDDTLAIGVNAAHSDDTDADLGAGLLEGFAGTRQVVGADVRWTPGRWLLAAEGIRAGLDSDGGPTTRPDGYHITAGFKFTPRQQVLLRFDSFSPDGLADDREQVIAGYNLWPTRPTELQVNYVIPTDGGGFDNHQILVNAQVGF